MKNYELLANAVSIMYEDYTDCKARAWDCVHKADSLTEEKDTTYDMLRHAVCYFITREAKKGGSK